MSYIRSLLQPRKASILATMRVLTLCTSFH